MAMLVDLISSSLRPWALRTKKATPHVLAMAPLSAEPDNVDVTSLIKEEESCLSGTYRPRVEKILPDKFRRSEETIF